MEEIGSRQQSSNINRIIPRNQTILTRTNSATQLPQYVNQIQYTSPLQEVQRRVLNDFAAQVQSTFQPSEQIDDAATWERESVDSLEASNNYNSQKITPPSRITGPIVRSNHTVNIQTRKTQQPSAPNATIEAMALHDTQEMLRRSYHESFFVKNTPVTGDEQVTAWLGVNKNSTTSNQQMNSIEKPSSLDGNDPETSAKRKSILKRSPSVDSNAVQTVTNTKSAGATKKANILQVRTGADKARVKDSLEVINAKILKDLEIQVRYFTFTIYI